MKTISWLLEPGIWLRNSPPLSQDGIVSFRTNASIKPTDQKVFTTIVTLYDNLNDLFKAISKRKLEELKFNRPDDKWIKVYRSCAECFFEQMIERFPEVNNCLVGEDPKAAIAENRREDGGHILFRPVGQRMLAQLVAESVRGAFEDAFEDEKSDVPKVRQSALEAINVNGGDKSGHAAAQNPASGGC